MPKRDKAPNVPEWVKECIYQAAAYLDYDGTHIRIKQLRPSERNDGNGVVMASTTLEYPYMAAVIRYNPRIRNNRRGRLILIHEVAHIGLWPMQGFALLMDETLGPLNSKKHRRRYKLLVRGYRRGIEQTVERLARALYDKIYPPGD